MADETPEDNQEGGGAPGGSRLGFLLPLGVILLAVAGGLLVYYFVIAPKFADPGEVEVVDDPTDFIPEVPQYYEFEPAYVNLMREGDDAADTLMYAVTFECADTATLTMVETHKARFTDMLNKLHGSRTREEVDDIVAFQESVQRQAKQKANAMLTELDQNSEMAEGPFVVTAVFHTQCMVAESPS